MKMSYQSKRELIKKAKNRYLKKDKFGKAKILDELFANTEMNRKYLISLLSAKKDLSFKNPINRKRGETYDANVICYLKKFGKYLTILADKD